MLVTTHVLSGAVIGAYAPDAGSAFLRGFGSHFVLDAIPHWGTEDGLSMRVAVPDGLVGLAAIAAVGLMSSPGRRTAVLAGVLGACLPDVDKPAVVFFGRSPFPRWFDAVHAGIQHEREHRWRQELVTAAGLAVVAVAVLRARR